jgi:hypothetical protein
MVLVLYNISLLQYNTNSLCLKFHSGNLSPSTSKRVQNTFSFRWLGSIIPKIPNRGSEIIQAWFKIPWSFPLYLDHSLFRPTNLLLPKTLISSHYYTLQTKFIVLVLYKTVFLYKISLLQYKLYTLSKFILEIFLHQLQNEFKTHFHFDDLDSLYPNYQTRGSDLIQHILLQLNLNQISSFQPIIPSFW